MSELDIITILVESRLFIPMHLPAKILKYRFSESDIGRILALNIYDRSEDELESVRTLLSSNDLDALEFALRASANP
ncbi:hypothetical protein [Hafnia paralvei]|uniref:hypothetical protein n=1 Tax=Hafnia paralvei TaxID=546367 RepID=UPI00187D52DB|nr:hypothetical protein [Hafnia paralvei]